MRVPIEWLKEFVSIRLKPAALAERLTMAGLEGTRIDNANAEPVLDVEITPNRADCLSIIGIAREVAAMTGQRLKHAQGSGLRVREKRRRSPASSPEPPAQLMIRVEDRTACPQYIGRLIEGVTIGPSPEWMQQRLAACGIRPINNVVDVTNYILLEYGQPLHAFDADRLAQQTNTVRRTRDKEPITTLHGVGRTLTKEMLVIADGARVIAVAGVMGGMGSEVLPQTRRVVLESAWFDPITVRRTARALGLASESSYRFERGVDPLGVDMAAARAAGLIGQLASGVERARVAVGEPPKRRTVIPLDGARLNRWLGTSFTPAQLRTTLARLSCRVASSAASAILRVEAPSFRRDLTQDVDLYEEIARLHGYDRPRASRVAPASAPAPEERSAAFWRLQSLRCLCASFGLTEAITWSLLSEADLSRLGIPAAQAARVANPLSQDHAYVRPTLLPGLLRSMRHNVVQGSAGVAFFEVGQVVRLQAKTEQPQLGIALWGAWTRDWQTTLSADFFRLKGLLEGLISRLCQGALRVTLAPLPWAEPGTGTALWLDARPLGVAGQVARTIATGLDIEVGQVWFAELEITALLAARRPGTLVAVPPSLPPVKRDLSLLLDQQTPYAAVISAIREAGGTWAEQVQLIDRYTGAQTPPGKYSLTFSIEYRNPSRTLTAAEVDQVHQRIGAALKDRFGATLR